ncbi:DUF4383 domain-containing protein [Actinomycetospora rhizophila]|uniref:DUF4383 domain-containing protein n=1 Tax=Actinomycetospora rhizophila TaxID=1416876 RepID=A0ABV9ZCR3_9PSEU
MTSGAGVVQVHRIGAVVVALVIAAFGVLGLVGGLSFFDTEGAPVLGLSTNGALSTISLVTAVVLVAAAIRGGRLASTVMMVVGTLFLVSAFVNLALIGTAYNLLAFRLPNVFFSIGAGCVLLFTGAYGRASAKLPPDNPYKRERRPDDPEDHGDAAEAPQDSHRQPRPSSAAEAAADAAMAEAERALAQGAADDEQRRRLAAVDHARTHEERRAIWMQGA